MNKIGCIIQARLGSTRLPGKVMLKVDDKHTVIHHLINQLQKSKFCQNIVVATTTLHEDDKLVDFLKELNVECFRGSSDDCLDRYYQCSKEFQFSIIIRITSDNPLIDPTLVDEAVNTFLTSSYDCLSNCKPRSFPYGTEVEIFSFNALQKAWNEANKMSEREHVTPYFYNNPNKFKIFTIKNTSDLSHLRWTVDRKEDLLLVQKIIERIKKSPILMKDVLELFKKEPELINLNKSYVKDEGYLKSLKEDKLIGRK